MPGPATPLSTRSDGSDIAPTGRATRTGPSRAARMRRAYLVWGIALFAYVVTVAGRTSLGVASVQAAERFEVGGAVLSLFGVVQLGTYAAAQFPAGLALDRFGPRKMLLIGCAVMLIGQLLMAFVPVFWVLLLARFLIGAGDAAIFISVIRVAAAWFPARRVPLVTQLTGVLGQLGQVISAIPFFSVLLGVGWGAAFGMLAALVFVAAVLVLGVVRDEPQDGLPTGAIPVLAASPFDVLRDVLRSPGAWAGMFTHYCSLFAVNTYVVMWGVPFLTQGHGLSTTTVSALLTAQVLVGMVLGPTAGLLSGRFPHRRALLVVIGLTVFTALWAVTLAVPGERSAIGMLPLVASLGLGAAVSGIGFDLARTGVNPGSVGTATGFVNVGGFGAGLVSVLGVGLVLDLLAPGGTPTLDDFRLALAAQAVLLVIGLIGFTVAIAKGGGRVEAARPRPRSAAEEIGEAQAQARAGSGNAG